MRDVAALISAIAILLWPIFAFVALIVYHRQLGDLIARVRKGKLFGQEIELDESLDKLEMSATAVAEEVADLPSASDETAEAESVPDDGTVSKVLHEAARSPTTALIYLASELEREARQLLASLGLLQRQKFLPLSRAFEVLDKQYGGLPGNILSSLKLFWQARNQLVHGGHAKEDDILRAIDSGITILQALRALPREKNYVYHPGVTVYKDANCTVPWLNTKGVILETESPGGARRFHRIFPTTKTHFTKGTRVAWEWDTDNRWADAWYEDPDTGEKRLAWNSSMEFVGRNLDEV